MAEPSETVTEEDAAPIEELELLFDVPMAHDLPTQIILFRFGETDTVKGKFVLDEESAAMVMAKFYDQGIDRLPFDVGHGMLPKNGRVADNPDAHKAYGWFIPAIIDTFEGGKALAATQIQWTKAGAEALHNREFRFYSPGIYFDGATRKITKLLNVALTNLPATKNQSPLVLDATEVETTIEKETEHMQILLDSLGATDEASAVAKVGEFTAAHSELQELLAAVEAENASGAKEAIAKLKTAAEAGIEAQAELSAIASERAAEKRAAAIETLSADGKLLDSQKEFAASLSDDQFETFSATLSAHPALKAPKIESLETEESDPAKTPVEGATFVYEDTYGVK